MHRDALLVSAFIALAVIGILLIVYAMQAIAQTRIMQDDPSWLRFARRAALALVAIGLALSVRAFVEMKWVPWPHDIIIVGGIDLYVLGIIISHHLRAKRGVASLQHRS